MKKILLSVAALLVSMPIVLAQRTFSSDPNNQADKKNSPTLIITESTVQNFTQEKEPLNLHTSVKLNPLLILAGDMPIYIEQKIAKKMSVEVGVGLTYDNMLTELLDSKHYREDVDRENAMSYSVSGALRYYPSRVFPALEGYYFAPELRYRNYKANAFEYNGERYEVPQSRTFTDYKLTFGFVDFIEDHILMDFYAGIGIRNRDYVNLITPGSVFNDQTQTMEYYTTRNETSLAPIFSLGFKLGFSF